MKIELGNWVSSKKQILTIAGLILGNAFGGYLYVRMDQRIDSAEQKADFLFAQTDAKSILDRQHSLQICEQANRLKLFDPAIHCQTFVNNMMLFRDYMAHVYRETNDLNKEGR